MADQFHHGTHRTKGGATLKIGAVVLGVLVLLGVVQAVTAGTVGVGALSVTLRESATPTTSTRAGTTDDTAGPDGAAGLDGALGPATSADAPPSAAGKSVTGSWKQSRGLLTVEVTEVEDQAGRVRVHVTAVNASTSKMDLPIPSITAVDDAGREYRASLATSKWSATIAKNSTLTGIVDLDRGPAAGSSAFALTFGGIVGQLAPTGGEITVPGIPFPA
ncbi:hypothetical protein [Saccharothrix xinjiangensis]|uniref:DUF4352 domain-containing protein n=1 Tax=Saccharothrix xinjiangensis TaxID=204798 RepID=A0ABV9YE60_9PSEU